ncbi:MAG TPA: large conductance mechanosensitive channel protein MscL [Acidimicrobiales bacterium]|nr:large conductance mechanosensitive channel protein MscL [Acidimicrobiales bacterium]
MLKGFKQFVLRGNAIDLAIAVVIGLAFNAVIQALVRDIVTPLIGAIAGKPDFGNLIFTVHHSRFLYGDLANYVIGFLSVAAAVYFLVVSPMNALHQRRRAGKEEAPVVSEEIALLSEIRDLLARPSGSSTVS